MSDTNIIGELVRAKIEVMRAVPYIQKKNSPGLNYKFASEAAFIEKLHPAMVAAGLAIAPEGMSLLHQEVFTTAKGGKMNRVLIRATFRLTHVGGGSEKIQTMGEAADSGDKAVNKAMTAAYKYALRQAFLVETGDDPDETPSANYERAAARRPYVPAPGNAAPPPQARPQQPAAAHPPKTVRELVVATAKAAPKTPAEFGKLYDRVLELMATLSPDHGTETALWEACSEGDDDWTPARLQHHQVTGAWLAVRANLTKVANVEDRRAGPPPDPATAAEREMLLARVRAACDAAGTDPAAVLRRHAHAVGGWRDNDLLPAVEALTAMQLSSLCNQCEMTGRIHINM